MTNKLLFRVAEAADALGVSRSKAYELIKRGEIPAIRVGASTRIPVDWLREWIDRQLVASGG
jgi:excisionase family DNA binding protein